MRKATQVDENGVRAMPESIDWPPDAACHPGRRGGASFSLSVSLWASCWLAGRRCRIT